MPLNQKYILVCDDVRREDTGKQLIIGLYTPNVVVTQLPATLPSLAFFQCVESDRPTSYRMSLKLNHLESGETLIEAMGGVTFAQPGLAFIPWRLGTVQFKAVGAYTLSIDVDDQTEPFLAQFSVILHVPQKSAGP